MQGSIARPLENVPADYSLTRMVMYFLWLGTIGFGGPIALAAYMQRDLVHERRWLTNDEYLEGLALAQLAPGPLAAQLAMYLGFRIVLLCALLQVSCTDVKQIGASDQASATIPNASTISPEQKLPTAKSSSDAQNLPDPQLAKILLLVAQGKLEAFARAQGSMRHHWSWTGTKWAHAAGNR